MSNEQVVITFLIFAIVYFGILGFLQAKTKCDKHGFRWIAPFAALISFVIGALFAILFDTANKVHGLEIKRTDKPQQVITDLPILLSVYDTALCEPHTPCLQGDGDGYFATMLPVSGEWYGKMAACPPELLGSTIVIPYLEMEVYCGDNFGSLNGVSVKTVVWGSNGYVRVDVFWPVKEQGLPEWNYWEVEGWYYEWR